MLYLTKDSDELISFCTCEESLVASPGQLDCPWCGCVWLFSCTKCHKAFSFARAVEIDRTLEEIALEDLERGGYRHGPEEIAQWVDFMTAVLEDLEEGARYVYLDGMFHRADRFPPVYEGWAARHTFDAAPHVAAAGDRAVIDGLLGKREYWLERAVEEPADGDPAEGE